MAINISCYPYKAIREPGTPKELVPGCNYVLLTRDELLSGDGRMASVRKWILDNPIKYDIQVNQVLSGWLVICGCCDRPVMDNSRLNRLPTCADAEEWLKDSSYEPKGLFMVVKPIDREQYCLSWEVKEYEENLS